MRNIHIEQIRPVSALFSIRGSICAVAEGTGETVNKCKTGPGESTVNKAIYDNKKTAGFVKRRKTVSFTLLELLIVIAIISILMTILLPALKKSKDMAKEISCSGKLKQAGISMAIYVDDYNQSLPVSHYEDVAPYLMWFNLLQPYMGKDADKHYQELWECPADENVWTHPGVTRNLRNPSYGINLMLAYYKKSIKAGRISMPSQKILVGETRHRCEGNTTNSFYMNPVTAGVSDKQLRGLYQRHRVKSNILWVDGHIQSRADIFNLNESGECKTKNWLPFSAAAFPDYFD